ncbi:MAG: CBS domain-containing protein [bacterium]|nr:CBS domain-containing protein [bacterium]
MNTVREEFVFLSDWMNRKVFDEAGNKVGKCIDVVADAVPQYPTIVAFVILHKNQKKYYQPDYHDYQRWLQFDKMIIDPRRLNGFQVGEDQFLVRDWLWDRQVVDTSGAKVKRVNDVQILIGNTAHIIHVDVGFTGFIRRLGFEKIYHNLAKTFRISLNEELISWKFVAPVQTQTTLPLRLTVQVNNLRNLHPAELADVLEELSHQERTQLVRAIGAETAAAALEVADEEVQKSVIESLTADESADILEEMELPSAADVLEVVREDIAEAVLAKVEPETREDISELAAHEEETAGSVMSTDFITCYPEETTQEVLEKVKLLASEIDAFLYIYVVNDANQFIGVVSLRSILSSAPSTTIYDIMHRKIYSVSVNDSLEEVAELFLTYDFAFCPVVENGELKGVISLKHAFEELLPYIWKKRHE